MLNIVRSSSENWGALCRHTARALAHLRTGSVMLLTAVTVYAARCASDSSRPTGLVAAQHLIDHCVDVRYVNPSVVVDIGGVIALFAKHHIEDYVHIGDICLAISV